MFLNDKQIRQHVTDYQMIHPFSEKQVKVNEDNERVLSWGVSSYGYDFRCSDTFKIFTNVNSGIIDPKNFNDNNYIDVKADSILIPPNSFALTKAVEYFKIPRDVFVNCLSKSTYARAGIHIIVTPLEPEWEGELVVEIVNTTPLPVKIYANEGLGQLVFFKHPDGCEVSYKDRGGKYQGQTGITLPKV